MAYPGLALAIMLGVAIGTAMYVYFQADNALPNAQHGYRDEYVYDGPEFQQWDQEPINPSSNSRRPSKKRRTANDKCSICLEQMSANVEKTLINCGHQFHDHCITMWFRQNRTCPICRKSVP